MSNDREIAALKRRLGYHIEWAKAARAHAEDMLSDDPMVRAAGEGWWRQTLNQPPVVLSEGRVCGFCRASFSGQTALADHIATSHGPGDGTGQAHRSTT